MDEPRRVTGIGGVFFRSSDPRDLAAWYRRHLGIPTDDEGHAMFFWRDAGDPTQSSMTVWSLFPRDSTYFGRADQSFMLNYLVDDLEAVLAALRAEGVAVDDRVEDHEYGRFGWITDPEGNRIELWEPPRETQE